jgi:hypothetical protein
MTRIFKLSILVFGLTSVACSSSYAIQEDSKPFLPTSLSQIIDKEEASKKTVAPWRYASQPKRIKAKLPTSEIGFATEKPNLSVATKQSNQVTSKSLRQTQPQKPDANASPKRDTSNIANAARVLPQRTSPMKPVKFSFNDQSLQSSATRTNQMQRRSQLDVATVMSFPANDALISSKAQTAQTNSQPQVPSQDPRLQNTTNVYRAPVRFDLASAKTKSIDKTTQPANRPSAAVPNAILRLSVIGPEMLIQDTSDDFELVLYNTSNDVAQNIIVQMQVSEDLTIVDFDRKAFLNDKDRTVSWKIDSVAAGVKEVIRFRAVSASTGRHQQNVSIGMNNKFQGSTPFTAVVIENIDDESRQRLEFEK